MRHIWMGLAAFAVLAISQPVAAQNLRGFERQIREIDPDRDIVVRIRSEGTLAWVTVSDIWYAQECFQKDRLATGFRNMWRSHGGTNVVVEDTHGRTVADFKIFGSGWKIPGCD